MLEKERYLVNQLIQFNNNVILLIPYEKSNKNHAYEETNLT